jgi:nucleotide-sensitive chloride channel 1A
VRSDQSIYMHRLPLPNYVLTCLLLSPAVEPIFEALSYCASLHPDPQESDDGEDDDDDGYIDADTTAFEVFTGDEGEELSEVGRVRNAPINDNRYQPY